MWNTVLIESIVLKCKKQTKKSSLSCICDKNDYAFPNWSTWLKQKKVYFTQNVIIV